MRGVKQTIPFHRLREATDQGYLVERFVVDKKVQDKDAAMEAHRDDHYIFLLQVRGKSRMMIDFTEYGAKGTRMMVILPGQVHKYLHSDPDTVAWFVALDVGMVPERYRSVLEDPLLPGGSLAMTEEAQAPLVQCLELIRTVGGRAGDRGEWAADRGEWVDGREAPVNVYDRQAVHGLLKVFVAMVTSFYSKWEEESPGPVLRPRLITQSFRVLLGQRYRELKSPAGYATEMNLSLSYLNEAVKGVTGFPVSYWIHHEVMLEARRLLFHSNITIKEIANELGYEDHAYFSRLFSKVTGRTPGAFRRYYRE